MKTSPTLKEFNRVFFSGNRIYHQMAQLSGLSDAAFNILYSLADLDGICCQSDLCVVNMLPKQTVHSAIRSLQAEGYVTLEKGSGRRMRICLTEKGWQLIDDRIAPVTRAEDAALSAMTRAEQHLLIRLMGRYFDHLQKEADRL